MESNKRKQAKFSKLAGDDTQHWADAHLTKLGISQAKELNHFVTEASKAEMPFPSTIYVSPLARCLQTAQYIYSPIFNARGDPFKPTVKELIRERLYDHPCDGRSSRSWIADNFPGYVFEEGFREEDELWKKDVSESDEDHVARKQKALEEIWDSDDGEVLTLVTHSKAIEAICGAVNTEAIPVSEGTMIPMLIKAEKMS